MRYLAVVALSFSTACSIPNDMEGSVYEITDETVTIRGAFQPGTTEARPTPAMIAQARDVCPGAEYLSANPSPTDEWTFLYLFRCPGEQ